MTNNKTPYPINKVAFLSFNGNVYIKPYDPFPFIPEGFAEFSTLRKENPQYVDHLQQTEKNILEWFEKLGAIFDQNPESDEWWKMKQTYADIPRKIIKDLTYTEYYISLFARQPDWFEKSTDLLFSFRASYGFPAIGVDIYLQLVRFFVHHYANSMQQEEKSRVSDYIEQLIRAKENDATGQDVSVVLLSVYQKWLQIFPFGIRYFQLIKKQFEDMMPVPLTLGDYRSISNTHEVTFPTTDEYISYLFELTKKLLLRLNSSNLMEAGLLDDLNRHRLDLINENHRIRQTRLLGNFRKGEQQYINIVEKWLANEEKYFRKITDLPGIKKITQSNTAIVSKNLYTFGTAYSGGQLENLRNILIKKKYIQTISDKDFSYIFSGQKIYPGMTKIVWQKPRSQAHYFLKVFVYQDDPFDFKQTNRCITFSDGNKLDSNSKTMEYHDIDLLFSDIKDC